MQGDVLGSIDAGELQKQNKKKQQLAKNNQNSNNQNNELQGTNDSDHQNSNKAKNLKLLKCKPNDVHCAVLNSHIQSQINALLNKQNNTKNTNHSSSLNVKPLNISILCFLK